MTAHWFAALNPALPPITALRRFLREAGRVETLRHVSRVAVTARRLARRFDLSIEQSDVACVAHDLAAVVPARDIITCAEQLGLALTAADRAAPQVLHGPVAAEIIRVRLNVKDEAVLDAVRYHTTLRAGAAPLEQLVFIADKIDYDPTTRHTGFHPPLMEAVRAHVPLPALCWIYIEWAVREGPELGWMLHPHLLAAYAELKQMGK